MQRVFIAIEIPPKIKNRIEKIIQDLKLKDFKPIPKENWHITLVFIGNTEKNKLKVINEKLKIVKFLRFEIKTKKICKFRNMLWLEIENGKIEELTKLIRKKCILRQDLRKFKTHINLGKYRKAFSPIKFEENWQVGEFILFQSQLLPQGAKYTKIKGLKLI